MSDRKDSGDGSDISDYVKFLIIFFFYVNEIENEESITGRFLSDSFSFGFFPPAFVLFCWPRKQTSLFFAPVRLCHKVQANLHLSEKAWENNVQFATRTYDASVDGFSLKKGGGGNPFPAPPIFLREKAWGRGWRTPPETKREIKHGVWQT